MLTNSGRASTNVIASANDVVLAATAKRKVYTQVTGERLAWHAGRAGQQQKQHHRLVHLAASVMPLHTQAAKAALVSSEPRRTSHSPPQLGQGGMATTLSAHGRHE